MHYACCFFLASRLATARLDHCSGRIGLKTRMHAASSWPSDSLPLVLIQTLIKSIIRILYLKTLPQALHNTSLTKAKPLGICLPCLLMQKVAVGFYGEIEIFAVSLLYCPLD